MPAAAGITLSLVTSLALAYERTYLLQNPELHGGDLSATLAPERNRIRIGDDVLELRTCSTDWSDMCVSSSYFKLVIPHDVSRTNWSYEGISFEPVSYTHLDVYKRQVFVLRARLKPAATP